MRNNLWQHVAAVLFVLAEYGHRSGSSKGAAVVWTRFGFVDEIADDFGTSEGTDYA
jgi:hypothetical protein